MRPVEQYKVVQEFLDRVCKQVRARAMHPEIREELLGHIEERTELLMLEGNAEEPAVQEAVKQMGIRGYRQKPASGTPAPDGVEVACLAGFAFDNWVVRGIECGLFRYGIRV